MKKNHLFSSCELMSDLTAILLLPGEEAFCCICIDHDCEKTINKESLLVNSITEESLTVQKEALE